MAVAAARGRAHRDEDRIRAIDRRRYVQREGKPSCLHIPGQQHIETRFKDGDLAPVQLFDLARILVDADNLMPEVRKTDAGHQPDISRPDHRNLH